jgi:hypothetical protein
MTLPWGSCLCNGRTIPRFDRSVCDYFTLGVPSGVKRQVGGRFGTDLDPTTLKNFRESSASAVREQSE